MAVRTGGDARTGAGAAPSGPDAAHLAGRRGARLPRALASVVVLLAFVTVVLALLDGRGRAFLLDSTATLVVLSVALSAVGGLVAGRRPRNPLGWLFLAVGLCEGLLAFSEEYAIRALLAAPGSLPLGAEAAWLKEWIWVPGLAVMVVLLPLLFPSGRPPSPAWWWVAWVGGAAAALGCVTAGLPMWAERGPALLEDRGSAEYALAPEWARLTDVVVLPLLLLATGGALASLVVRFRGTTADQRRPLVWFFAAAVLTVVATGLLQLPVASGSLQEVAVAVTGLLVAPSIPVAVGAAVLSRRLYGIDVVVNRALVYGALVLLVTGGYVVVVATVGRLLSPSDDLFAALVATGLVAVAFAPARARLQRAADRLLYGDRADPYAAMSRLVRRTGVADEPRQAVRAVVDTVARALRSPYVAVEIRRPGPHADHDTVAEVGRPDGQPSTLPLEHQGTSLGRLVVSPRPGKGFDRAERRLLADLARQAASVVHSVLLTLDLQRSRERLVGAREEERRRLRRTLHDELGPSLSSAALKLAAVRRLLPAGSPADDLLDELRTDLRAAVRDLRKLAYDLRPSALDQLGLPAALAEFVEARRDAGDDGWAVEVTVEADGALPPLPAAAEVAAYWIAREALTNVARHARADHCRVRLAVEGRPGRRELALAVTDDGNGFGPDALPGVGTAAMRERAEELGGSLTLTSTANGTRVVARLPVHGTAS